MRKSWVTLLSIIMIVALVAGCGGKSNNASKGNTPPPATNNGANQGKTDAGGDKAEQPKPVLRQLMQYDRFDPNDYPVGKALQEATGYEIKYDMLPVENSDEKLNLLMANQESYDFMKLTPPQFAHLASSGALEPLDELIEKYGTNMKKVIKEDTWNGARLNGQLLAVPESSASGVSVGLSFIYRADWLEELNIDPPTNLDEFVDVLREIKAKKNVIPLTGGKDPFLGNIGQAMGWNYGLSTEWKVQDGKIIHMVEDPATIEFLTFMNALYDEGLIDPEWAINQSNILIERFTSGNAFMVRDGWWNAANINNAIESAQPGAKVGILPPLKDKNGVAGTEAGGGITYFIAIPKWSKNKEETIKYLDAKFEEATFKELSIGKEGTHHYVEDNKYYPILPIFEDEWNFASGYLTGIDEEKYPTYWQARVRKNPFVQNAFETFQELAKGITYMDALTYAPPIPEVSKNRLKLRTYAEDEFIKFITGAEPLSNYDRFIKQWRADGGDEMIKAANEWYDTVK